MGGSQGLEQMDGSPSPVRDGEQKRCEQKITNTNPSTTELCQ